MTFRPLALFALTASLAVLVGGNFTTIDAQEKPNKKNKKKVDPPEAAKPADPVAKPEPVKPVAPPVLNVATPKNKDAAALAKVIDAEVNKRLADAKLTASARSTDEEFLRRVSVDIIGVIPTADRARAFLDDTSTNKREKLIDELLADPRFGRRMADIWTAKLFPKESNNRFVLKDPLYKWLEAEFNKNPGWDKFVTSLVSASGAVSENGAVTYFIANRTVDKLTDTTAQHFLGIQLQCRFPATFHRRSDRDKRLHPLGLPPGRARR
ncbi:MAG: DUF1549 domain-containing protein, partial [Gemmata sp.]